LNNVPLLQPSFLYTGAPSIFLDPDQASHKAVIKDRISPMILEFFTPTNIVQIIIKKHLLYFVKKTINFTGEAKKSVQETFIFIANELPELSL
jgi:hypothetical protein